MKNTKKRKPYLVGGVAIGFIGLVSVVWGQAREAVNNYYGETTVNQTFSEGSGDFGAVNFIAPETGLTDVDVTNDLRVQGELEVQSTSTVQHFNLDSQLSESLSFSAGATTTVGGPASFQWTGTDISCPKDGVQLRVTGITDSYNFSVGTSTSASAWSGAGASLIATTTVPTSTTVVLNGDDNVGTQGESRFVLTNGVYVNVAFDAEDAPADNATSSAYTSAGAGKLYLHDCYAL